MADRATVAAELMSGLLQAERVDSVVASPDGSNVGVVWTAWDSSTDVTTIALGMNGRRYVLGADDVQVLGIDDDCHIWYTSRRVHDRVCKLWAWGVGSRKPRCVLELPPQVSHLTLSRDGRTLAYLRAGVGEEEPTVRVFDGPSISDYDSRRGGPELRLHLMRLCPDGPLESSRVDSLPHSMSSPHEVALALAPDGKAMAVIAGLRRRGDEPGGSSLTLVDLDTHDPRVRWHTESRQTHDSPVFSPDGSFLVTVCHDPATSEKFGATTLWRHDVRTGAGQDVLPGFEHWPMSPACSAHGDWLYFTAWVDGRCPIFRAPLFVPDEAPTRLTKEGHHEQLTGATAERVYAVASDPVTPPAVISVDSGGATVTVGATAIPKQLARVTLTRRSFASTFDGTLIPAWVIAAEKPVDDDALVLNIHGGPGECYSGWTWNFAAPVFAAAGFTVALPDPSPTPGYGAHFYQRGYGRWREVTCQDVLSVRDQLTKELDIGLQRTALIGASFGAVIVNLLVAESGAYGAAVSHAGVWDLERFYSTTDDVGATWLRAEMGHPEQQQRRYRDASGHGRAGRVRTPMLITHGERDLRIPVEQSITQHQELLRLAPISSRLVLFDGEGHVLHRPGHIHAWYRAVLSHLRRAVDTAQPDRRGGTSS